MNHKHKYYHDEPPKHNNWWLKVTIIVLMLIALAIVFGGCKSAMKTASVTMSVKDCATGKQDTITIVMHGGVCVIDQGNGDSALIDKRGKLVKGHICDFNIIKVIAK